MIGVRGESVSPGTAPSNGQFVSAPGDDRLVWSISGMMPGSDKPKNKLPKSNFVTHKPQMGLLEIEPGFPRQETDN
jgi:hypothetical protein